MSLGHTGLRITCSSKPQDEHFRSSSFAPAKPNLGSGRDATRSMWAPQRGQGTGLAVGRADAPSSAATRRSSSSMRASRRFNPIHSGIFSRSLMMSDTDSTGTAIPSLPFSSPLPTGVAVHELTISNILIAHRDDGKIVLQIVDGAGNERFRTTMTRAAAGHLARLLVTPAP